jgi:peptide-methionine (R)-S-oxide reductase
MNTKSIIFCLFYLVFTVACNAQQPQNEQNNTYYSHTDKRALKVSDNEWKKILAPKVFHIMREKGTEPANTGPYVHNDKKGVYYCAACGNGLFSSGTKFDSHTGWPSFFEPLNNGSIAKTADNSLGMERDEVLCKRCGGHLGHVFDDGPRPTGLRYCMNGYALVFEEK